MFCISFSSHSTEFIPDFKQSQSQEPQKVVVEINIDEINVIAKTQ